jgi:hypothetical protein
MVKMAATIAIIAMETKKTTSRRSKTPREREE